MGEYESQSARDAQRIGYGDEGYWNYLDRAARENRDMWLRKGDTDRAEDAMTRTLTESLRGNDGD